MTKSKGTGKGTSKERGTTKIQRQKGENGFSRPSRKPSPKGNNQTQSTGAKKYPGGTDRKK